MTCGLEMERDYSSKWKDTGEVDKKEKYKQDKNEAS